MYIVCVTFLIKPDHLNAFLPLMRAQANNSVRLEEGCNQFDVCQSSDNEVEIFLYEVYDDASAFQIHLKSSHFVEFDTQVAGMIDEKTIRTYSLVASGQ